MTAIQQITDCRCLGLCSMPNYIEKKRTEHTKILSRAIGVSYKARKILPTWLKVKLYYAQFYQKLYYCFLIWGTSCETNYPWLFSLQKRIIRTVANANYDANAEQLLESFNILPLCRLYNGKHE